MIISFVILSYNRELVTIDAIKSVLKLTNYANWEKEIVILNNGSTEPYNEIEKFINEEVRPIVPKVNYIHSEINYGVSGGRNMAYKAATGDYLFFLDDDAEVLTLNAIELIAQKFEFYKNDNLAIIGIAVKLLDGSYTNPVKRNSLKDKQEFLNYIFWGGACIIKKNLFETVGFYPTDFFYGMEEYELSYRTINNNMSILFTKDLEILHKVNPAGRESNTVKFGRQFQNKTLLAYIYLPTIFFFSHLLFWSLYFVVKSRFKMVSYFVNLKSLIDRINKVERTPISKEGMLYMSKVNARLWY